MAFTNLMFPLNFLSPFSICSQYKHLLPAYLHKIFQRKVMPIADLNLLQIPVWAKMGARRSHKFCLLQFVMAILSTEANKTGPGNIEANLMTKNKPHDDNCRTLDKLPLLDKILQNYEKWEFPPNDSPTEVQVRISVAKLTFQESESSFKIAMYFILKWKDPRLIFSSLAKNVSSVRLLENDVYRLWIPLFLFRFGQILWFLPKSGAL